MRSTTGLCIFPLSTAATQLAGHLSLGSATQVSIAPGSKSACVYAISASETSSSHPSEQPMRLQALAASIVDGELPMSWKSAWFRCSSVTLFPWNTTRPLYFRPFASGANSLPLRTQRSKRAPRWSFRPSARAVAESSCQHRTVLMSHTPASSSRCHSLFTAAAASPCGLRSHSCRVIDFATASGSPKCLEERWERCFCGASPGSLQGMVIVVGRLRFLRCLLSGSSKGVFWKVAFCSPGTRKSHGLADDDLTVGSSRPW